MKCELAPSILSCDPGRYREAVAELLAAGVERVHFDVMDGQFVPPITFGAGLVRSLRDLGDAVFEAHLMTLTPESHFNAFLEAGCQSIIFHQEATPHAHRLCQQLRERGIRAGVALNPSTPVDAILEVADVLDLALVMTVNPGWGGQEFLRACLRKVETIRRECPDLDIEVDGGIDPLTLGLAKAAGANVFVAGSFLASCPTLTSGVEQLRAECD